VCRHTTPVIGHPRSLPSSLWSLHCTSIVERWPDGVGLGGWLQHVQNSAARNVLQVPRRSHAKPLLRQLHWLSVQHQITYKLAVLTYKVRTTLTPVYLSHHIKLCDSMQTLRSTTTTRLSEPFASTAFAKRAFRCSTPATWNSLPRTVTDNDSLGTFKSRLKSFLFSLAFN